MPEYPNLTLRLIVGPDTLFGPGKGELLEGMSETGSITAAGRRMGMGYKRARYLMDTLNQCFGEPVIKSIKRSSTGGSVALTDTGKTVLDLYRTIQRKAEAATVTELRALSALAQSAANAPPSTK